LSSSQGADPTGLHGREVATLLAIRAMVLEYNGGVRTVVGKTLPG